MRGPRPRVIDVTFPGFALARRIEYLRRDACKVVARAMHATETTPVGHDPGDEQR